MMPSLRTFAEHLARNRVVRRSILTRHGRATLYVSPDAQLKYLKLGGGFDSDLVRIAEEVVQDGDCVWDIGANVGTFTFASAIRPDTRVVAIEADPWLAGLIRRSAALAGYRPGAVDVLCCAAAGRDGVEHLRVAARGRASSALASAAGRSQMGGVRETIPVPALSLATLVASLPAPDLVKVDVEGAEVALFANAATALRTCRPLFYAEIGASEFPAVETSMTAAGYCLFNSVGEPTMSVNDDNYFLAPAERLGEPRFDFLRKD